MYVLSYGAGVATLVTDPRLSVLYISHNDCDHFRAGKRLHIHVPHIGVARHFSNGYLSLFFHRLPALLSSLLAIVALSFFRV
jgi:hypothetical protein